VRVSIYGAGQVGTSLARILSERRGVDVLGPYRREDRAKALGSGADVVVIATTSFLRDVADDVRTAIEGGSNVLTTAEEAAFPWAVDAKLANDIDMLAKQRDVSVLGRGLNPGFTFDALVATACGPCSRVRTIRVERVVDLSGFGSTVLRRIGVGYSPEEFETGARDGRITGHIGFPQSMALVGAKLGVKIDRIEKTITSILAQMDTDCAAFPITRGQSGGFEQNYMAFVGESVWFTCKFTGHVMLDEIGLAPRDELWIDGDPPVHLAITPGLNPQRSTPALIANSLQPLVRARAGWLTVADLPPAIPE
jgi:2,4-diaminopentanoate dehydrogenase